MMQAMMSLQHALVKTTLSRDHRVIYLFRQCRRDAPVVRLPTSRLNHSPS